MSKIGKTPITIKEGVTVIKEAHTLSIVGPKGTLSYTLPDGIDASIADGKIIVLRKSSNEKTKSLYGLARASLANMVEGVVNGFEKKLEMSGVGYRAQVSGNTLTLSLGYSHPVKVEAPQGLQFTVAENTIKVFGTDKTLVGDIAAKIRSLRKPEPYKGKGIRYQGERIRRKAGKAAKAVGTK